jgi:hypothetical protein
MLPLPVSGTSLSAHVINAYVFSAATRSKARLQTGKRTRLMPGAPIASL